jgi:hypothetical protein
MRKPHAHVGLLLLVMTVGVILVLPGVSQAGVVAKYQKDYKYKLGKVTLCWSEDTARYSGLRRTVVGHKDIELSMLDPQLHPNLLEEEKFCASVYAEYLAQPLTEEWTAEFESKVIKLKARAGDYFTSSTQRKKFKSVCVALIETAEKLNSNACADLLQAYQPLGFDPPDFTRADQLVTDADAWSTTAKEDAPPLLKKLRAML